jgi:ADP-ribose pyrophosphatase
MTIFTAVMPGAGQSHFCDPSTVRYDRFNGALGISVAWIKPLMTYSDEPRVLFSGKFLQVIQQGRWEYVHRNSATGAAVIIAVTDDRQLILVEQYRIPVARRVIELPAGLVGDQAETAEEASEIAARRELLEETGFAAHQMKQVAHGPPSAGLASEIVTLFVARGLSREHDGGGDDHEQIQVHLVPLAEADAWLQAQEQDRGVLIDPKVYAGLYFATRE